MNESMGLRLGPITRRSALSGLIAALLAPSALAVTESNAVAGEPSPQMYPRTQFGAALMADGRILVTGGYYLGPLSSVMIFNPADGSWTAAAPMSTPRYSHGAAALPNGLVLAAGGLYLAPMSSAEVYDPTADSWTVVAPMNVPRYAHSADTTSGGVAVFGGYYLGPLTSSEIFNGTTWQ